MKEVISGWVMILDMYYYRKRLMKRYNSIKYYQRHRILKSDSVGFIDHLSSSLSSVYNFCFKRSNKYKSNSLNEAIRKQLEIHRRKIGTNQIPYSKNPPPPKRKIDKSKDVFADFVNVVGRRRFKDWKDVGNYDTTKRIADSNVEKLRNSTLDARVKNKLEKHQDWKLYGYRLGVFNQDEVRMLLDNREISEKANIPEIGVDKDLLSELESKMSYLKII